MTRPSLELASIFRQHGESYRNNHALSLEQLKPMHAIEICRTAALGGHVERCGHCQHQRIAYNSCRNRHCPKCQTVAREQWLERRKAELLPTTYYHLVFTLPPAIAELALQNKKSIYNILFSASAEALLTIARDPKHLGPEPAASSPCALRRHRRRHQSRPATLGELSQELLSERPRSLAAVPQTVHGSTRQSRVEP